MSKTSHAKHEHKQNHQHKNQQVNELPHEDYQPGLAGDILIFILILGLGLFFVLPFYGILPNPGNVIIILTFLLIIVGFVALIWRRNKKRQKVKKALH